MIGMTSRYRCRLAVRVGVFLLIGCSAAAWSGCMTARVQTIARVVYGCSGGVEIKASYHRLSDGTLQWVKLTLPDGEERVLPRAVSASGDRYSEEFDLDWWARGNEAFARTRDAEGNWVRLYTDCFVK